MPRGIYLRIKPTRSKGKVSPWKGKTRRYSEETLKKMSISNAGKKRSEETKKKLSESHMGHIAWNKGLKGLGAGRHHTKETCKKISEASKLLWKNPKHKAMMSAYMTELWSNNEYKKSTSSKMKGRIVSPETKMKFSLKRKGIKLSDERKSKMKELWTNPTYRKNQSSKKIELWKNITYRNKVISSWITSSHLRPTKPENELGKLLQLYFPNQYMYSGDGKVVFPCGCPDFWNINGQKKAILVHGIYWHLYKANKHVPFITREIMEMRDSKKYKQYGIDALIIWEDELQDPDKVIEKIRDFNEEYKKLLS